MVDRLQWPDLLQQYYSENQAKNVLQMRRALQIAPTSKIWAPRLHGGERGEISKNRQTTLQN